MAEAKLFIAEKAIQDVLYDIWYLDLKGNYFIKLNISF